MFLPGAMVGERTFEATMYTKHKREPKAAGVFTIPLAALDAAHVADPAAALPAARQD